MILTEREAASYLAGVLHGDAWCTALSIGLRVADRDFAAVFSGALSTLFGIEVPPRRDERGYWLVRRSNKTGMFDDLRSYRPEGFAGRALWLRGLFDSEGNAQLLRRPRISANAKGRRVAFYSTDPETLRVAETHLAALEIPAVIRPTRNSASHIGRLTVYELVVRGSREAYTRFATIVGSSIARKRTVLEALPLSYRRTT